jgi:hypothetical protein
VSFTCIQVLSVVVLEMIGTRRLWLVEMRLTLGRLLSIEIRYHIPTRGNRPSGILLQRSVTEHNSTCKFHFRETQQA